MPNKVTKVKGGYANINQDTGKSHGTTTKANAIAQNIILRNAERKKQTGKGFLPPKPKGKR